MHDERSLDEKLAPQDFVTDFVWAARAVASQPGVALVSVTFWCLPMALMLGGLDVATVLICAGFALFGGGWDGAERMFFLYRREGKSVSVRKLLDVVPKFMGRFLRLGLLVGCLMAPPVFVSGLILGRHAASAGGPPSLRSFLLVMTAVTVATDLLLTFATSALVFTTRSALQALRIGVKVIRQTWPRSGLYVLCPPLALNMLNAIYPIDKPVVRLVVTATLAVLALLAKGATAAFYLREHPVTTEVVPNVS